MKDIFRFAASLIICLVSFAVAWAAAPSSPSTAGGPSLPSGSQVEKNAAGDVVLDSNGKPKDGSMFKHAADLFPTTPPGAPTLAETWQGWKLIVKGKQHTKFLGATNKSSKTVSVSIGGVLQETDKMDNGDFLNDLIDGEIAAGSGSQTLWAASVMVVLHELFHVYLPDTGSNGADPYSCEHLAFDRLIAEIACAKIMGVMCGGENPPGTNGLPPSTDNPPIDEDSYVIGLCIVLQSLNGKWEAGPGNKASGCADDGMEETFSGPGPIPDPTVLQAALDLGLSLPTPEEMTSSKHNAVPDCDCCLLVVLDCCEE